MMMFRSTDWLHGGNGERDDDDERCWCILKMCVRALILYAEGMVPICVNAGD